ncbi:MAG: hypothetical protein N4A54_01735 [Peptostreptococcaceae bacterium]|jgi:soluble cytochrome b562|nr:hypothetical protein [Peptostreptococcaceae bacterium]
MKKIDIYVSCQRNKIRLIDIVEQLKYEGVMKNNKKIKDYGQEFHPLIKKLQEKNKW